VAIRSHRGLGEEQEAQMPINRSVKKLTALLLVAAAVAGAAEIGAQPGAAGASGQPAGTTNNQGNPNAVPPILAPVPSSNLVALEARELGQFSLDPPASGRWSNAETNAYASQDK
jgi:hypothetical protein